MKVKIVVNKKVDKILHFLKSIKTTTGLGLREAKDIVDTLNECIGVPLTIEILDNYKNQDGEIIDTLTYLKNEIKQVGGEVVINNSEQWVRNFKMLSIGIGEVEDYSLFLKEYISSNNDFLDFILAKFEKEELKELINKISENDSNL